MPQDETSVAPKPTLEALREHFPFPTLRPTQESALEVLAQAHDSGTRFTIIEAPTGSGKSGIGMAPARWAASLDGKRAGAHYLTSQNSLSTQLVSDFSRHGLVQIRGKSNYPCSLHRRNCEEGSMLNPNGRPCDNCSYRAAKETYTSGKLGVTNYTYYLTETMFSGQVEPRNYLICDEAHNIEREILALVETEITPKRAAEINALPLPRFAPGEADRIRHYLTKDFLPPLNAELATLSNIINDAREKGESVAVSIIRRYKGLNTLNGTIRHYLEAEAEDWLAWTDSDGNLLIKPLSAWEYADKYLFDGSPNVVLMSATILDFATFRRNLGIRKRDAAHLAVPSEFPAQNRRIVYWPVGSMGSKNIEASLPRLVERIKALLDKYADKKGIIHTNSYKINSYLLNALRGTAHGYRLRSHTNVTGSREQAIADHCATDDPSLLVSPSMTEGLDLKGDLSRLQILTKVPYPFLDPYNRARLERDPKWYQLQTALTLVQATGRSIRSADDWALTVILDQDFGRFLSQNQDILPQWWLDSIEFR